MYSIAKLIEYLIFVVVVVAGFDKSSIYASMACKPTV